MQTFRYLRHMVMGALCGLFITGGIAYAQKVIRIGAPLELTGKFVSYGSAGQRGVEMAVEAFGGTVAGHRIEVLLRDTQSTNPGTISAMTDLIEKEKVDFLIGPVASGLVVRFINSATYDFRLGDAREQARRRIFWSAWRGHFASTANRRA